MEGAVRALGEPQPPVGAGVNVGHSAQAPSTPAPKPTDGTVLSAAGGIYEATPEAQRLLVLTDQGLFYVTSHRANIRVCEFVERLRRKGMQVDEYPASIESITAAYKAHSLSDGGRRQSERGSTTAEEQHRIVELLSEGLQEDASDLHFILARNGCDLRFRVMGELETRHPFSRDEGGRLMSSLYNTMCDIAQQSYNPNSSQRARMSASYTEALGLYGARVQTRPTHDGLLMVLRLLKSDDRILTHKELGYLDSQVALIQEIAAMPYGFTVVSGPTGSGKSRSLQASMHMLLQQANYSINVITIEDPPEYPIPGAIVTPLLVANRNDREMVSQAWQDSISEVMRLDPDIIMVGEISDLGSARTAFSAAKTGHGVWSTLHANDATSIPKRLVDLNVSADDVLDPTLLVGLTAQRLVPELCHECKIPLAKGMGRLRPSTLERLKLVSSPEALQRVFVRGNGCNACRMRGINGRVPVIEVVKTNVEFMDAYMHGGPKAALLARRHWVNDCGGITMLRHALHLVWSGRLDPLDAEDVRPLTTDLEMLSKDYAAQDQLV